MRAMFEELQKGINVPTIRAARNWNAEEVMTFCKRNGFYKRGSNEEYADMLRFVSNMKPSPRNLYLVARDILIHTEPEDDTDEDIAMMMEELEKRCVTTYYYTGEAE